MEVSYVDAYFFVLQLLRQRRPFVARLTDAMGNELFRVRIYDVFFHFIFF
jgi:hypothetical protein